MDGNKQEHCFIFVFFMSTYSALSYPPVSLVVSKLHFLHVFLFIPNYSTFSDLTDFDLSLDSLCVFFLFFFFLQLEQLCICIICIILVYCSTFSNPCLMEFNLTYFPAVLHYKKLLILNFWTRSTMKMKLGLVQIIYRMLNVEVCYPSP